MLTVNIGTIGIALHRRVLLARITHKSLGSSFVTDSAYSVAKTDLFSRPPFTRIRTASSSSPGQYLLLSFGAGRPAEIEKEADLIYRNIQASPRYWRDRDESFRIARLELFDAAMTCWEHVRPDPPKIKISDTPAKGKAL